jgi:hypothetical protein
MTKARKNIEPRGGARPVGVRHTRHEEWRRRTDAQTRVKRCSAMVWDGSTAGSKKPRDGRTEAMIK